MEQAEARAEREVRSAAAAEARQAREKLRRQAQARRVHKDVIMSDHQRRMVEGVLRGLSADPALLKGPAADSEGMTGPTPKADNDSFSHAIGDLQTLSMDCKHTISISQVLIWSRALLGSGPKPKGVLLFHCSAGGRSRREASRPGLRLC